MHKNYPLISILILNWNRKKETARAIKSALEQTYSHKEVVVVDNGSTDGSGTFLKAAFPDIEFVQLEKNYGCPGGRNRGILYTKGEYVFYCDNDGVLQNDAIEKAYSCMLQDERIAVITGTVKNFNGEGGGDIHLKRVIKCDTNKFFGGVSLHKKSIYDIIGYYPDDYIYGEEETYLSLKLLDAGYIIRRADEVILWHQKSMLARDCEQETIQKWGNSLMNAWQLFPLEFFLFYFFYYITFYPFFALREGYFIPFFKNLVNQVRRLKFYSRVPVKRSTFWKFRWLQTRNSLLYQGSLGS